MSKDKMINVCIPEYRPGGLKAPDFNIEDMLEGSIANVITNLQKLESKLMNVGYFDISLSIEAGYEGLTIEVYGNRYETKSEKKDRLDYEARAEKAAIKKREGELKKLAELKSKYPDA